MKKILVPVDFSTHTGISCQFALNIAIKTGAEITLFHSFFDQIYFSDGGYSTGFESGIMLTDNIIFDFFKQKENSLKMLAEELSAKSGQSVKVECRIESGDPEVQILNIINQITPDLIIMGSSGMGRKSLFAGSVARRIMSHSDFPVIAIPEEEQPSEISNVVYMTNFDPDDNLAIAGLDSTFSPFKLTIYCLHLSKEQDLDQKARELEHLKNCREFKSLEGRIFFELVHAGNITETLNHFIREKEIDLIAFIPNKRNIFKNLLFQGLTKEDLFNARKPLMALKPAVQ